MDAADFIILALVGLITGSLCEQVVTFYVMPAPAAGRPAPPQSSRAHRLPVIGALILWRGKGSAGERPAWLRRLLAETAGTAGALALGGLLLPGLLAPVFAIILAGLLISLSAIDLRRMILPDPLNAGVFMTGLIYLATGPADALLPHAAGAAAGYTVLRGIEFLYRRLRGIDGLGRGDAKLLGALGLWNGLAMLAPILLIASVSALAFTLLRAVFHGSQVRATTAVAFGPWLALGGYLTWIAQTTGLI